MMFLQHLPELVLLNSSLSASDIGGDDDTTLIYLRVLSRSSSLFEACLTLATMFCHWPSGNALNFMRTLSTNFLYHCSKDLNEPLLTNGTWTIQSARFVPINGFSFRINNQLYQYIDNYGGAFGLARAEPTYLHNVEAARPSMLVLNALY